VVSDGVGPPPPQKNVTIDTIGTHSNQWVSLFFGEYEKLR